MLTVKWSELVADTEADVGNTLSGTSNSWRKSRKTQILILLSLAFVIGSLILVTCLAVSSGGRKLQSHGDSESRNLSRILKSCGSYDCNQTGRIIQAKMNTTIDPCENFFEV